MVTQTPTYGLQVPTNKGDGDVWGLYLNNDLSKLDYILNVLQTNNIGASAPTLPPAIPGTPNNLTGSFWLNNGSGAGGTYPLQIFDGTTWVVIGNLNTSTHTFSSSGALFNIQTFTTSGTYTPTVGATYALVTVVGGGGGGAASSFVNNASNNPGANGGTSTFGAFSASGGGGGYGFTMDTNNGLGGLGGVGTGGFVNLNGNPGQSNILANIASITRGGVGTNGGGSYFQGGGQGTNTNGNNGTNGGGGAGGSGTGSPVNNYEPGGAGGGGGCTMGWVTTLAVTSVTVGAGGAGGASNGFGNYTGGNGGNGIIVIYEYA